MQGKRIAVFRFYASHWRGAGHAMRCLTLAKALEVRGWECRFATEAESYEFIPALQKYTRVDPDDFSAKPFAHDLLVVDHYDYGFEYESRIRPFTKVIMAIDDLADRKHDCDIILDQAYGRTVGDYEADVPVGCDVLVGPKYALLREEFLKHRDESLARRKAITRIERVFVNFGGNDQKNMILETLRKLSDVGYSGAIDVVFGVVAQHRESVEAFAKTMPNEISFYTNPDMAPLMVKADFAIGAPGVSACERFCMGLPTLLIQTADNQDFTYKALMRDGLALGGAIEKLDQKGFLVDFDKGFYADCVARCTAQTDGQGAYNIAMLIESKLDKEHGLRKKVS